MVWVELGFGPGWRTSASSGKAIFLENACTARDPDIESLNPGYAQPAYR